MHDYVSSPVLNISPIRGIYFLINKGKVVYVGQSEHIPVRIHSHRRRIQFDEVRYLQVPESERLDDHERAWIESLKPVHNTTYKGPKIMRRKDRGDDTPNVRILIELIQDPKDRRFSTCIINGKNLGRMSPTTISVEVRRLIFAYRP